MMLIPAAEGVGFLTLSIASGASASLFPSCTLLRAMSHHHQN
jgi:hypothetical protein